MNLENKNILITKPENAYYQTGFKGSFAQLLKTPTKSYLITDSRYKLMAESKCKPGIQILIIEDYQKDLSEIFKNHKIKTLYFESTDFTYAKFLGFQKLFPKIKLKPLKNEIDLLRIIKTDQEIDLIQKSQLLNEKVLTQALKFLKPGVTEKELANKIVTIGLEMGAEKVSFDPIVAFGKNSASPHYTPDNCKLGKNDIVLIDMGFVLNGYCSDMSRTFLPKNPTPKMQKIYDLVLQAQNNCINNLRPGMTGIQADKLSRDIFKQAGLDQYFTHANGHGVGLEIHESPSLSSKAKHKDKKLNLATNMVVTVEPGLYFEGEFGIRIEDMVAIGANKNSSVRNLTQFPK
jgi:Xaa-Pro aminopeptidase